DDAVEVVADRREGVLPRFAFQVPQLESGAVARYRRRSCDPWPFLPFRVSVSVEQTNGPVSTAPSSNPTRDSPSNGLPTARADYRAWVACSVLSAHGRWCRRSGTAPGPLTIPATVSGTPVA